jgi:hypothetical protein
MQSFYRKKEREVDLFLILADIQTNFAIAIVGMTIFCIILIGFPLAFMLTDSFRMRRRRRTDVPSRAG